MNSFRRAAEREHAPRRGQQARAAHHEAKCIPRARKSSSLLIVRNYANLPDAIAPRGFLRYKNTEGRTKSGRTHSERPVHPVSY